MSRCASCGGQTTDGTFLCTYHPGGDAEWARVNRAFCDLFHRHVEAPRVAALTTEEWVDLVVEAPSHLEDVMGVAA
ncbi:MAG TPA: hypothetical protein VEA38_06495 [Terriglobales bacterium]|nr:hypothetical protein [Terriglobales bacterium]